MKLDLATLTPGYIDDFARMHVLASRRPEAVANARKILSYRARYEVVQKTTTTPWFVVGLLHYRESDFDFGAHLTEGSKLSGRTKNVPKGLPVSPEPPYPWETGAIVGIRYDGLDKIIDWSIAGICYATEKYNGFGPRKQGRHSGYLYGGTDVYDGGKYVKDGVWDPDVQDKQLGVLAILVELMVLCPEVADIVHGKVAAPVAAAPIALEDAKASIAPERTKELGIFGVGTVALGTLQTQGLPTMAFIAIVIVAVVGMLIWHRLRLQHRYEHLQDAAAITIEPVGREVARAEMEAASG